MPQLEIHLTTCTAVLYNVMNHCRQFIETHVWDPKALIGTWQPLSVASYVPIYVEEWKNVVAPGQIGFFEYHGGGS